MIILLDFSYSFFLMKKLRILLPSKFFPSGPRGWCIANSKAKKNAYDFPVTAKLFSYLPTMRVLAVRDVCPVIQTFSFGVPLVQQNFSSDFARTEVYIYCKLEHFEICTGLQQI